MNPTLTPLPFLGEDWNIGKLRYMYTRIDNDARRLDAKLIYGLRTLVAISMERDRVEGLHPTKSISDFHRPNAQVACRSQHVLVQMAKFGHKAESSVVCCRCKSATP